MDVYRKKNDTYSGERREKEKTTQLVVNKEKKISKKARLIRKKQNREKTKEYIKDHNKEGKYGDVWIWSAIDPESKYIFPDIVGTRKRNNGLALVKTIKNMRGNDKDQLLIQTDDYDVYEGIIKECFAEEIYTYFNNHRNEKIPQNVKMPENIQYTVLKKNRTSQGDIEAIEAKILLGKSEKILKIITAHKDTNGVNTNYIERSNLNRRLFNARLNRKTLKFSKDYNCLVAQLNLQRIYSNFCWKHRSLTEANGFPTSPAMAVQATDCIWTLQEIFFNTVSRL